jgi:predicted component of type VI protein secretion system
MISPFGMESLIKGGSLSLLDYFKNDRSINHNDTIIQKGRPYKNALHYEKKSPQSSSFLNQDQYIKNILENIYTILHTRCGLKKDEYFELSKNDMNKGLPGMYGLPDCVFSLVNEKNSYAAIIAIVLRCIRWYEPRLLEAIISDFEANFTKNSLSFSLYGAVLIKKKRVLFSNKIDIYQH